MIEVEIKFRCPDRRAVEEVLARLGATCEGTDVEEDRFFAHPVRDFAASDEVLRLRSTPAGRVLTYKGPKRIGPGKMREELESGIADPEALTTILARLGFAERTILRKTRTTYALNRGRFQLHVLLDEFPPLGTFCEVEIVADEDDSESARSEIMNIASELRLADEEPRSYLAMHLELQGQQ